MAGESPSAARAGGACFTHAAGTGEAARRARSDQREGQITARPEAAGSRNEQGVEFEEELKSAGEKLIVVDFSATWCGPCKMIKPFFHSLCEKYGDVVFIEIDVDDAQDVASHCDVKCMPTFQFYKNGKKVQEFSGANKEKLEETIKSLV
ncbi:thioredoxin [Cyanistes caeruleus]|nr:thioredoxin [Cyanistes caeruleus]